MVHQIVARKRSLSKEIDGGHRRRNKKGIRYAKGFYAVYGKIVMNTQMLDVSLLGSPSRKGCVVNGKMTEASNN